MSTSPNPDKEDLTGKSRLISNVVTSWIAQILVIVTGFFLPRVIDTNLGQVGLGIWDFAWSITSYISLGQLGIGAALNRYIAKYRSNNNVPALITAISTTVLIQFALAIIVAMVSVGVYYGIPVFFAEDLGDGLETARYVALFLGFSVAMQLLFDTSRGILTGCHRWDIFNAVNSSTQIGSTFLMIIALLQGVGLMGISLIYLISMLIQGIARTVAARYVCPEGRIHLASVSYSFAKEIFMYGVKSIAINIPPLLTQQGMYIATVYTLGPASLAILARPMALIRYIETFITRFTFVLTPMVESVMNIEGRDKLIEFILTTSRYGMALVLPPVTLLAIYGNEVITLWMGSDYVNEYIIWILCLGALLSTSQSSILRVIIGLDVHGPAARVSLIMTAVTFVIILGMGEIFDLFCIEYFASGIAFILVAINGVYIPLFACKALKIPLNSYLSNLFHKSILSLIFLGALLYGVNEAINPDGLAILLFGATYLCLVAVVYFYFLVPQEIKNKVVNRFLAVDDPDR